MSRPLHEAFTQRGASYLLRNARTDKDGYLLPVQPADAERLALGLSDPRYSSIPVTSAHVLSFVAHTRAEGLTLEDIEDSPDLSTRVATQTPPSQTLFPEQGTGFE